jgi:hypothetical protein
VISNDWLLKIIEQPQIQKAAVAKHLRGQKRNISETNKISHHFSFFRSIPTILQLRKLSSTSDAAAGSTAPQLQRNLHSVKVYLAHSTQGRYTTTGKATPGTSAGTTANTPGTSAGTAATSAS